MDIGFAGKHKSLRNFTWNNIQALTVLTGLNGSGKSQLLEIINNAYLQVQPLGALAPIHEGRFGKDVF